MKQISSLFISILSFLCAIASLAHADVHVEKGADGFTLMVDGQPFYVQGITYGSDGKGAELREHLADIKSLGANAIRTWGSSPDGTKELLDVAEKNGLKVMVGIWLRHGRPGAEDDDSFNWVSDQKGIQDQKDHAYATVRALKDHPAVLCWGVGNEVILNMGTEKEKVAYSKHLEEIAAEIKKIDPNHPVASVSAWAISWPYWKQYCPSLDIYGVNTYGYGAAAVPGDVEKLGIERPYLVCEFGASGEWEAQTDPNGVKREPDDQHKYDIIASGWYDLIAQYKGINIGGFVFNYGGHRDHTGMWLSLRTDDYKRPQYWATLKAFTGQDHTFPKVETFLIKADTTPKKPGEWVKVMVEVADAGLSRPKVEFYYNQRQGSREYRDNIHPLKSRSTSRDNVFEIQIPQKLHGGAKIYATVIDPKDQTLAAATSSLKVE